MKNKVVVVGSYNTDLTIKAQRIPRAGETIIGGVYTEGGGGKGANQAVAAARAGADVSFIARVGNDSFGDAGTKRLSNEMIKTKYILRDDEASTGVAFIVVDKQGENCIVVASGANAKLSQADIELASEEISSASVLLVQLESPIETIRAAIKKARKSGTIVILNPAPALTLSKELLRDVEIITPNKVEAEMITGIKVTDEESMRLIAEEFFMSGVKNVIITLGSKGIFTAFQSDMEFLPSYKVDPVDTTGAGDVFSGSLAAFISEGMPIYDAAKMAIAASAMSVMKIGALDSAPHRNEIEKFYSLNTLREVNSIKKFKTVG